MTEIFFSSSKLMADSEQSVLQILQPAHFSASTMLVADSTSISPLDMRDWTSEAAAEAWATVSGMSLGPWQAPAIKIPSVAVDTGASFGCRSVKNPSPQLMWKVRASLAASSAGIQAGCQDDHVHRDPSHLADQSVFHPDNQLADLFFV